MDGKKVELIDEVFTKKFIASSGGKNELSKKILTLKPSKKKSPDASLMSWRKGIKGEIYFAKYKSETTSEFIVVKEDGKLKINGTLSDAN
jgi:hypothetical protein